MNFIGGLFLHYQREIQETLLLAWLEMTMSVRGNRFLSDFSLNEIMICNLLIRQQETNQPPLTATELCTRTHLLKSQMNHILTNMEARHLIQRERGDTDKRMVYVHLREEALSLYQQEHEHILQILETVCTSLGYENAQTLADLMQKASVAATSTYSPIPKEES